MKILELPDVEFRVIYCTAIKKRTNFLIKTILFENILIADCKNLLQTNYENRHMIRTHDGLN